MTTITIPKKEYEKLVGVKLRYDYLHSIMEGNLFSAPPTRDAKKVVVAFRVTKKYDQKFLRSLANGLKRSSHFRA